jgi:aminopeptidase
MLDPRFKDVAELVASYSLYVHPQDVVLIRGDAEFEEQLKEVGTACERKGAKARYALIDNAAYKAIIERADPKELERVRDEKVGLLKSCTAVAIGDADAAPDLLASVDPAKIALYDTVVGKPYNDILYGDGRQNPGMKWSLFSIPAENEARAAGMRLKDYADMVFSSILKVDWPRKSLEMRRIKQKFDHAGQVRIVVPGQTDLSFSLSDRSGDVCDGHYNLPDGEVFYGPVENSVNGHVTFSHGGLHEGRRYGWIKMFLTDGRVTGLRTDGDLGFLETLLTAEGANRFGEFGIGCNDGITRVVNNALFDEKILGTVHLALGASFVEAPISKGGGYNDSTTHWDLIVDLRPSGSLPGGRIYVDNRVVQENGIWHPV